MFLDMPVVFLGQMEANTKFLPGSVEIFFFGCYRRTEFKELTAHFQFSPDYPASPLIIELKSKPLDFKLLQGLEKVCTEEAQKYLNKQQVGGRHSRVPSVIMTILRYSLVHKSEK